MQGSQITTFSRIKLYYPQIYGRSFGEHPSLQQTSLRMIETSPFTRFLEGGVLLLQILRQIDEQLQDLDSDSVIDNQIKFGTKKQDSRKKLFFNAGGSSKIVYRKIFLFQCWRKQQDSLKFCGSVKFKLLHFNAKKHKVLQHIPSDGQSRALICWSMWWNFQFQKMKKNRCCTSTSTEKTRTKDDCSVFEYCDKSTNIWPDSVDVDGIEFRK